MALRLLAWRVTRFMALAQRRRLFGAIEKRPRKDLALAQFWQWLVSHRVQAARIW